MFGADPYLAERSMALRADAAREEAQRSGVAPLAPPLSKLFHHLSLTMVRLGGRLVRAGLPSYDAGTGGNGGQSASRGEAPA